MEDDSSATPGVPPASGLLRDDENSMADELYGWPTPKAKFPGGTYVIRIEAYRSGARLHYSFHQERIYITR